MDQWSSAAMIVAIVAGVVLATAVALIWPKLRAWQRRREAARALRTFRLERERLEARFFDMASRLGKPRGLKWLDCDWLEGVTYGRDLKTGLLTAFVAVNIRFEAIEGGDMEEVEAVGMVRDAAAVFHYRRGRWGTGGRVLFNMNPQDALTRLGTQYEPVCVATEPAPRM